MRHRAVAVTPGTTMTGADGGIFVISDSQSGKTPAVYGFRE